MDQGPQTVDTEFVEQQQVQWWSKCPDSCLI